MVFVELKNKVQSVKNIIDSLIDEVIELKSQVTELFVFDRKGLKLLELLQRMVVKIQKCQDIVEVITARIHGMQQTSQYISSNESSALEAEKYSLQNDFDILAAKYNETYLELVQKSFWANLKDAWQRFTNGVTTLAAKVLTWSFTGLIRPMLGSRNPKILVPSRSWWEKVIRK